MLLIDPISYYLSKASHGKGPLILMYHSIEPVCKTPNWLWSVSLERFTTQIDLLRDLGWEFRRVSELKQDGKHLQRAIAITFDDGYLDNFTAFEALAKRGLPATWFVVSANVGKPVAWSDVETAGWPTLDRGKLKEMVQAGMEIGGHTRHHCRLADIPPSHWADEISGCRMELQELLGRPVTSFAYPYGSHNDGVVAAVGKAGFEVACTTLAGPALADGHLLRLRRVAVYSNDSLSSFARKIGLARNKADWCRVMDHLLNNHRLKAGGLK